HIGRHANESRLDLVRLISQPDVWLTKHPVAATERSCREPTGGCQYEMIRCQLHASAVCEDDSAYDLSAARDCTELRRNTTKGPLIEASNRCGTGDLIDGDRITVDSCHPSACGDAADVVADTRRRDVALVGDTPANRLAIARVMVGAQHAEVRVARSHATLKLLEAP